jgi:hypothetical protein
MMVMIMIIMASSLQANIHLTCTLVTYPILRRTCRILALDAMTFLKSEKKTELNEILVSWIPVNHCLAIPIQLIDNMQTYLVQ